MIRRPQRGPHPGVALPDGGARRQWSSTPSASPPPHSGWLRRASALLGLLLVAAACGPTSIEDNVESAGPITDSFAVSRYFTASGYMGDGERPGYLNGFTDETCLPRPVNANGSCYHFEYNAGSTKWAGVFWQFPANNWGTREGRQVATSFSTARFAAAAKYEIVLPEGAGIGAGCGQTLDCRPGLACDAGVCTPARSTAAGKRCLVSDECAAGLQCAGQFCVTARGGKVGDGCGAGLDEACGDGLRCGESDGGLVCTPAGQGDVGEGCNSRNDCRAGLYCEANQCQPATRLGPVNFQVGGIIDSRFKYSDEFGVSYSPGADEPQPILTPDLQYFSINLQGEKPGSIIGAFMWATPFPDIDFVTKEGITAYMANPYAPAHIYLDDIIFVEAQ